MGTFGIKFLEEQVNMLATLFERVFILYDIIHDPNEDYVLGQEYIQAEKMAHKLDSRGIPTEIISLNAGNDVKDAGDLTEEDGIEIRNELLGPYRK